MTRLILVFTFLTGIANAQDLNFVRQMIDSLCAPRYDGRGYVNEGDRHASDFIANQVKQIDPNLKASFQEFSLGVNTFPGKMSLVLNDAELQPGADYIINPKSKACKGDFKAVYFDPKWADSREKIFKLVSSGKFLGKFVVMPTDEANLAYQVVLAEISKNPLNAAGYIILTDSKTNWSVGRMVADCCIFQVKSDLVPKKIKKVSVEVEQKYIDSYPARNVIVELPAVNPKSDSTLVFTAHLDHLGRIGELTYIPGANDNASGSSMLLDLLKFYHTKRAEYNMVFIWFAGEEAGLVGSTYYTENPAMPLEKIKFLINLDLMGDAKKGITVVNGKIFSDHFAKLVSLNAELGALDQVKARGAAANSDHHPFYEKGVPCFFIYTEGDYKHYHDINDKLENLPLTNYEKVFELITEFIQYGI